MLPLTLALAAALAATIPSSSLPRSPPDCVYLTQYRALLAEIRDLPPAPALRSLYRYQADPANDNPAGCDSDGVDENIAARELALVRLLHDRRSSHPRAVFHCTSLERGSLACNGVYADGTGQPNASAALPPAARRRFSARVVNDLPDSRLEGLYRTTLRDVQAGRPPVRLSSTEPVTIAPSRDRTVVIAIVASTQTRRISKFVWYP